MKPWDFSQKFYNFPMKFWNFPLKSWEFSFRETLRIPGYIKASISSVYLWKMQHSSQRYSTKRGGHSWEPQVWIDKLNHRCVNYNNSPSLSRYSRCQSRLLLLSFCHPIVILLSSYCYPIMTLSWPYCHPIVILLSSCCYPVVTLLSSYCYPSYCYPTVILLFYRRAQAQL